MKYKNIMFIIIVFGLGCDRPSGLLFFVRALLLSYSRLSSYLSSVSLSYFILAVPMRECLGNTHAQVLDLPEPYLMVFIFSDSATACAQGTLETR